LRRTRNDAHSRLPVSSTPSRPTRPAYPRRGSVPIRSGGRTWSR